MLEKEEKMQDGFNEREVRMTEKQALKKLTTLCSKSEHSSGEMYEKMRQWNLPDEAQQRVMAYLYKEKYVDDSRFSRFFVHDKLHFNKWGRRKIEIALWKKGVPEAIAEEALNAVPEEEYMEILRPLIAQKRRSVKGGSDYERNMKLVKFAISRGFPLDMIRRCVDDSELFADD